VTLSTACPTVGRSQTDNLLPNISLTVQVRGVFNIEKFEKYQT